MPVLIDGRLEPTGALGLDDRGVTHGFGLFETMRAHEGAIPLLDAHLERLQAGAARLGLALPPAWRTVAPDLALLVATDPAPVLRLRLTLTAGPPGGVARLLATATAVVPPHGPWSAELRPGHPGAASPLVGLKTLAYLPYHLAREAARATGHDEALLLDAAGRLIEGAASNVLVVLAPDRVATPSLACGPLPGIMRAHALRRLRVLGVTVEERELRPAELAAARGVLFTNAFMGAIAAHRVGAHGYEPADLPAWSLVPW